MDKEEIFLNIFKENLIHMRHQETQRMWISNVFIAIVVGVSTYLGKVGAKDISPLVPLAFFIISTICLLITLKVNEVFTENKAATKKIFTDQKIPIGENWNQYVLSLESSGIWQVLRVRYLYVALYVITIIASLILFGFTLANQ